MEKRRIIRGHTPGDTPVLRFAGRRQFAAPAVGFVVNAPQVVEKLSARQRQRSPGASLFQR